MAHGISPEVDPEEWPNARYVIVWGWNPMSTAPHLWRKLLDARAAGARIVVVDPFRSRTARVADEHLRPLPGTDAALAIGMMRAIVDAGLQDEEWCRAHADGYDELLAELGAARSRTARRSAACRPRTSRASGASSPPRGRRCCASASGRSATWARPPAYSTIASLPALTGAWRDRGGGCSYIPLATAAAVSDYALKREDLRPGPVRTINMSQLGEALTDPALDPPVKAFVCWNSNPAAIAPDQERVLEGLRRDDLFVVVLEQFMTDTAAHADVVLPATTQLEHLDVLFSWGHHYLTWNEPAIEPQGEAKPNTETFRLLAARLGLDDPCFGDSDEELVDALLADFDEGDLRTRGWRKIDLGQGPVPHAEGGFGTETGQVALHADYLPPAEVADAQLAERFPLAMITPKTHLFLNSTFANQAPPALGAALARGGAASGRRASRRSNDGDQVRVFNERGSFVCAARVSDDARPGVLVAPMGWWNSDYAGGRSGQATTSQALTERGHAPTFNDNRVEVEAL